MLPRSNKFGDPILLAVKLLRFPTLEVHGSNPALGKFCIYCQLYSKYNALRKNLDDVANKMYVPLMK